VDNWSQCCLLFGHTYFPYNFLSWFVHMSLSLEWKQRINMNCMIKLVEDTDSLQFMMKQKILTVRPSKSDVIFHFHDHFFETHLNPIQILGSHIIHYTISKKIHVLLWWTLWQNHRGHGRKTTYYVPSFTVLRYMLERPCWMNRAQHTLQIDALGPIYIAPMQCLFTLLQYQSCTR